jgi:trypsin-like peptidase
MQASRPGGARASRRWRPGARRRLACLLLLGLGLSGHARPAAGPVHAAIEDGVAEVLVVQDGDVIARGSAVVIAARDEAGQSACYLVTVGHVLTLAGGPAEIAVVLPEEDGWRRVRGDLLQQIDADDRDLAVLRTVAPTCRPARVGPGREAGADIWLAGFARRGAAQVWPGHLREMPSSGALRWTVDGVVTEGASGGGAFDARSGELVGLIQGYWTAHLRSPTGWIGGEVAAGTTAVIPMPLVRALLREWGLDGLLLDGGVAARP